MMCPFRSALSARPCCLQEADRHPRFVAPRVLLIAVRHHFPECCPQTPTCRLFIRCPRPMADPRILRRPRPHQYRRHAWRPDARCYFPRRMWSSLISIKDARSSSFKLQVRCASPCMRSSMSLPSRCARYPRARPHPVVCTPVPSPSCAACHVPNAAHLFSSYVTAPASHLYRAPRRTPP